MMQANVGNMMSAEGGILKATVYICIKNMAHFIYFG